MQAGYKVIGVDIKPQEGAASNSTLQRFAKSFSFVDADLSDPQSGGRVVTEAQGAFGPSIHVLINNAGERSLLEKKRFALYAVKQEQKRLTIVIEQA